MVKPFLVFEITVKALTLTMQKRLEPSFRVRFPNDPRRPGMRQGPDEGFVAGF
jgi:hypothetical protein